MSKQVQVQMEIDGRNFVGTATLTPEVRFTAGQRISLIGRTYRGLGTVVQENDDGSVSVRVHNEPTRTRKRVRVHANEVADMLTVVSSRTARDFNVGDSVTINGRKFVGGARVERIDGRDVLIRMNGRNGKLVRVFAADLSDGRLIQA